MQRPRHTGAYQGKYNCLRVARAQPRGEGVRDGSREGLSKPSQGIGNLSREPLGHLVTSCTELQRIREGFLEDGIDVLSLED